VTIELQNGEKIKGVVQYIAEAVDLDSKTMKVYVNPSEKMADLKINMFVKIYGDIEFKGIKIPKSAILNKDGKLYVFISKDSKFIEHEIKIFEDDKDENYSIINGLEPGSLIAQDTIMLDKP
jgi:hypothetical protein